MMNKSFFIGLFVGLLIGFVVVILQNYIRNQDGYHLIELVPSPSSKQVGVIIANMGGGGPGYCRDLVYLFPNIERLPDFSKEKNNKKYLVQELGCGEAKNLRWESEKLIVN